MSAPSHDDGSAIHGDLNADVVTQTHLSPQELEDHITRQFEYYFSPANLAKDVYLTSLMNPEGFVSLQTVARFPLVRQLTENYDIIVNTLRKSKNLIISDDGQLIKTAVKPQRNVVVLRDFPSDVPEETVRALFESNPKCPAIQSIRSEVGNLWHVTFETTDDALAALDIVSVQKFNEQPIHARIKSDTLRMVALPPPVLTMPPRGDEFSYSPQYYPQPPYGMQQWQPQPGFYPPQGDFQGRRPSNGYRGNQPRGGVTPSTAPLAVGPTPGAQSAPVTPTVTESSATTQGGQQRSSQPSSRTSGGRQPRQPGSGGRRDGSQSATDSSAGARRQSYPVQSDFAYQQSMFPVLQTSGKPSGKPVGYGTKTFSKYETNDMARLISSFAQVERPSDIKPDAPGIRASPVSDLLVSTPLSGSVVLEQPRGSRSRSGSLATDSTQQKTVAEIVAKAPTPQPKPKVEAKPAEKKPQPEKKEKEQQQAKKGGKQQQQAKKTPEEKTEAVEQKDEAPSSKGSKGPSWAQILKSDSPQPENATLSVSPVPTTTAPATKSQTPPGSPSRTAKQTGGEKKQPAPQRS